MANKILFIGPFTPPISGPSVKNSMLFEWLKVNSKIQFKCLNTNDVRKKPLSLFRYFFLFLAHKRIVLSVSKKGRFLFISLSFLFKKKVVLFPAGGSFDHEINNLPSILRFIYLKFCQCISSTFVETEVLKEGLQKLNFQRVYYLPNPRINRKHTIKKIETNKIRIIFLSKIREGKGPLLLINSFNHLLNELKGKQLKLDFYGKIDPIFEKAFLSAINSQEEISYKGVAKFEEVQQIISKYDIFVLPSLFPEGVPGAVVEAMYTGTSIVISNFSSANELIDNNKNGIIVPQGDQKGLTEALKVLIENPSMREAFSHRIMKKAEEFDIDMLMKSVKQYIEGEF